MQKGGNGRGREGAKGFNIAVQQNRMDVKANVGEVCPGLNGSY